MAKKLWKSTERLLYILPYIFVFIASLYLPSDPDLGWHLKYGDYFFKYHHILRDNTFAAMMPNFHWANGSWGTDVLTFAIFNAGGFLGLTLASAAVITLSFYFYSKAAGLALADQVILFPLLLYLENPINIVSFRGQQLSLLFIGILFYILSKYTLFSKKLFFLPLLFLIWANIHEEVFLALGLFGIWIGLTLIRDYRYARKNKKGYIFLEALFLGFILALNLVATCINPFGFGIYFDALSHFGNPELKNVVEYLPFATFTQVWWNQIIIGCLVLAGITVLYFKREVKYNLPVMGAAFLLFVLSFDIRRYAWPSYYVILPIIQPLATFLEPVRKKLAIAYILLICIISTSIIILIKMPLNQFTTMSWDKYCEDVNLRCSPESAKFIQDNKLTTNIFSLYGWGGWLIWNYPAIKPNIDGRMHLWKDETGYSAFTEYFAYEQAEKDINLSKYDIVYISPEKPLFNQLTTLSMQGKWIMVYQDKYADIFARKKTR